MKSSSLFHKRQETASTNSSSTASSFRSASRGASRYCKGKSLHGPFEADLLFRDGQLAHGGHVTYSIRVRGVDGEQIVHRRYNCFKVLHTKMQEHRRVPPMPPRSVLRKRFCLTNQSFMERRERGLKQVLRAIYQSDPLVTDAHWRSFLGLPIASSTGHHSMVLTKSAPDSIVESDD